MSPLATRLRTALARRRALREPSGFRIALADAIDQLNPSAWDAVVAGRSWFFSRDYLRMLEAVPPDTIEARYALVLDDAGAPVAAVVMQWAEVEGHRLRPLPGRRRDAEDDDDVSPLRRLVGGLSAPARRAFAHRLRERVLVCGNLLTYGPHAVAVAEDVSPRAVWPAVAEALYRVRRAEKLSGQAGFVIVKDVPLTDAEAHGVDVLQGLSYRGVETEPNMVLALDPAWKTHADYLGGMVSKYRSAVKNQVLAPIEKAGLAVRAIDPRRAAHADDAAHEALLARLHALYLAVHENAGLRPFTLHPRYFGALAEAAGDRVRFAGVVDVSKGDELLGFIVTLRDEHQALAYHIGFDAHRAGEADLPLYLRLLHASIEDAIALGARELSFGRTALEPKSRLGAKPQPMQVWMRHRQPAFNQLVTRLVGFAHHAEAPECRPFKQG